MRKFLVVFAMVSFPVIAFCQNPSVAALEKKYGNDDNFVFSFTGSLANLIGCSDKISDPELRRFVQKIRSLHILGVSNSAEGYSPRDIRRLKAEIKRQSFDELISINAGNGQLKLMVKDQHGKPSELIMVMDKDDAGFVTVDLSQRDPK